MDLTLELKQTQRLSPQMIQAVEILQMGTQELQEYVEKLLLENPVLEREERPEPEPGSVLWDKLRWLEANDRQNRWYHAEDTADVMSSVAAPNQESLYDYLRSQLTMERMGAELRRAVECVLTGLSGNGYLEETEAELAVRCRVSARVMEQAVKLVQTLEPAGVGAKNLSQCLALQLERRGERGLALTIAEGYLEDVGRNHYNQIARSTGASREEIQEACRLIRTLEPRPGAAFSAGEAPRYVFPDLVVVEKNGRFEVAANDQTIPELRVSGYYQRLMGETEEPQVREYLNEKVRQACWVVKGIEQRKSTLMNCARVIVARQEPFFRRGTGHLRPMTLADVAGELSVHESTVSRAVKDKYLQCLQGVFPLSSFFSRALPTADGEGVSAQRAKAALRALIEREDKHKPLSDQKLCDLLAQRDMLLSRRTVAKYRDEMGIPSTAGRKEF